MALAETAKLVVALSLKDGLTPGIGKALKGLGPLDRRTRRVGKGVRQVGLGFARAGVVLGAVAVGGIALATRKAIDFEDAFAGVRKTVEASPAELDALALGFRKMATEIPIAATELAGIGEAAGALGIPSQNILEFTRVVALLGVTTDVSTEAAATALGQLSNVLKLTGDDYDNFASTLVDLGNKGASTESQILEVTRRAGGAANLIGLATDETLGWAAAAANLGLQSEVAGSSLQRFFLITQSTVAEGGKGLNLLAKTAGVTAKDFKKAFRKDASGAMETFLEGLAKLPAADRLGVVQSLFGKQTGLTRLILGLADSFDQNLTPALDNASTAWDQNTAQTVEAQKRFATVRSSLTLLGNQLTEAAITIGEGVAPAIGRAAAKLKEFLARPENIQTLKNLGRDIGKGIDSIDWDRVLGFARTLVSAFQPALEVVKAIASAIASLPPELTGAAAGVVITNKLSGGLIGKGVGNILGGLTESATKNTLAKFTGGALGAIPVRVVNWGGFSGGGGGGGGGVNPLPAAAAGGATAAAPLAAGIAGILGAYYLPYLFRGAPTRPIAIQGGQGTLSATQVDMFTGLMPQFQALAARAGSQSIVPAINAQKTTEDANADRQAFISRFANTQLTRNNARLLNLTLKQQEETKHVDAMKLRLSSLQQRLHNAKEAGDRTRAAALRGKIEAVKGRINQSNARLASVRSAIQRLRLQVTVNTYISGAEVARRVAQSKTSKKSLSASKGYSGG